MSINHEHKIVDIWLSTQEARDPALKECLSILYQIFSVQKNLVSVFQSGNQDLVQLTSDLLRYNRKRIARLEVEREKQMEPVK